MPAFRAWLESKSLEGAVRGIRRWLVCAWYATGCVVCFACSVAIETDKHQCRSDIDCIARGLTGTTCVERLCQTVSSLAGRGMSSEGVEATAGRSGFDASESDAGTAGEPSAGGVSGRSACSADEECEKLGPEYIGGRCVMRQCLPNPKWRCQPVPPPRAGEVIALTVPIVDALTLANVAGVRIKACSKLDYTCETPVATATSGPDGRLKISVPANFAGYLLQNERMQYSPAMYFVPLSYPRDGVLDDFLLLPSGAIWTSLVRTLGANLDPDRGHIMLIAPDCSGSPQPGIAFSSPQADEKTVQFYMRDQVPLAGVNDTSAEGDGGYLNFPSGIAAITAREVKTGLELATVSLHVRPGFISVSYVRPMMRQN